MVYAVAIFFGILGFAGGVGFFNWYGEKFMDQLEEQFEKEAEEKELMIDSLKKENQLRNEKIMILAKKVDELNFTIEELEKVNELLVFGEQSECDYFKQF